MVGPVVVSGPVAPFLFISNFFPFFFQVNLHVLVLWRGSCVNLMKIIARYTALAVKVNQNLVKRFQTLIQFYQ